MGLQLKELVLRTAVQAVRLELVERSAALAYYMVLSFLPLLVLTLAGSAWALGSPAEVEARIGALAGAFVPGGQSRQVVSSLVESSAALGGAGVVTLLLIGSNLFSSLERVLGRIWRSPKRAWWRSRLLTLGMTLLVAVVAAASAALSVVRALQGLSQALLPDWLDWNWWAVSAFAATETFLVYLAVYGWLPNRRIPPRALLLGAGLATALFETARIGLAFYVSHLSRYDLVFGSLAGVFVLIFWAWFVALVTLLAAQVAAEYEALQAALPNSPP